MVRPQRPGRGYGDGVSGSGSCARPACNGPIAAWLTYDYAGQQVWLDDADSTGGGNRWALCARHAERLAAPRGWTVLDRRTVHLLGGGAEVVAVRREAELARLSALAG